MTNKVRRAWLVPATVICLSLSLAACGEDDTASSETATPGPAATQSPEKTTPDEDSEVVEERTVSVDELAGGDCYLEEDAATATVVACDAAHDGEVFATPTPKQCLEMSFDVEKALADYVGVAKGEAQQWIDESGLTVSQKFAMVDQEQNCPAALISADEDAQLTQSYRRSG